MSARTPRAIAWFALAALPLSLAACASDAGSSSGLTTQVKVAATDTTCVPERTALDAGKVEFVVANGGSRTTEFYVYTADGSKVVGEVEDITPGTDKDLYVQLAAGQYTFACKPGGSGDGIRGTLTVT